MKDNLYSIKYQYYTNKNENDVRCINGSVKGSSKAIIIKKLPFLKGSLTN